MASGSGSYFLALYGLVLLFYEFVIWSSETCFALPAQNKFCYSAKGSPEGFETLGKA